jgi:D-alanyl-D-alanine carboxypeptidase
VAEANRLGPMDEPGSSVAHYTNTNYILLGLIAEAITGNSWDQEIRSRIIEPLALEHTAFVGDEGVWGGAMVEGYIRTADGYSNTLHMPSLPHVSLGWAVGDVVSSAGDLLTFATALFDGELVSKETLAEMAAPVAKDDQGELLWGLGGATLEALPGPSGWAVKTRAIGPSTLGSRRPIS